MRQKTKDILKRKIPFRIIYNRFAHGANAAAHARSNQIGITTLQYITAFKKIQQYFYCADKIFFITKYTLICSFLPLLHKLPAIYAATKPKSIRRFT